MLIANVLPKDYAQTISFFFYKNKTIHPDTTPKFQIYMLYLQLEIKTKILHLQLISYVGHKKSLDLNIAKLQPHKRATFLKICESNISFNQ